MAQKAESLDPPTHVPPLTLPNASSPGAALVRTRLGRGAACAAQCTVRNVEQGPGQPSGGVRVAGGGVEVEDPAQVQEAAMWQRQGCGWQDHG